MILIDVHPQLEVEFDRLGLSEAARDSFYADIERMNMSVNRKLRAVGKRMERSVERMKAKAAKTARLADLVPAGYREKLLRAAEVVQRGAHLIPGFSGHWDVRTQNLATFRVVSIASAPREERAIFYGSAFVLTLMGMSGIEIGRLAAAQAILAGGTRSPDNSLARLSRKWSADPLYRDFFDFLKKSSDIS
jgi:hypothetical protein